MAQVQMESYELIIDFGQLREQKVALLGINAKVLSKDQYEALEGIINLVDSIQDYAVDKLGYKAQEVFRLTDEG